MSNMSVSGAKSPAAATDLDGETLALLDVYRDEFGQVPDELMSLLKNAKQGKHQANNDVPSQEVIPDPVFVIKTTDQSDRKVFINVTSSSKVPAPGGWSSGLMPEEVSKALDEWQQLGEQQSGEALRLPMSCGDMREDVDKKGESCITVDCIFNNDVIAATRHHRPFKAFLIQLSLNVVGQKHKLELDPKFKLPKMTYKGLHVASQRMRVDQKPLVTEVGDILEEPTFPLIAKKQDSHKRPAPTPAQTILPTSTSTPSSSAAAAPLSKQQQVAQPHLQQATTSPSSAGLPQTASYSIEYEGRPVETMVVKVDLPSLPGTTVSNGSSWSPDDLSAEVQHQHVYIQGKGLQPLHVELPFAVNAQHAEAVLQAGQLLLRLPYYPVASWVQQLIQQAPHAYGALPVANSAYMELE